MVLPCTFDWCSGKRPAFQQKPSSSEMASSSSVAPARSPFGDQAGSSRCWSLVVLYAPGVARHASEHEPPAPLGAPVQPLGGARTGRASHRPDSGSTDGSNCPLYKEIPLRAGTSTNPSGPGTSGRPSYAYPNPSLPSPSNGRATRPRHPLFEELTRTRSLAQIHFLRRIPGVQTPATRRQRPGSEVPITFGTLTLTKSAGHRGRTLHVGILPDYCPLSRRLSQRLKPPPEAAVTANRRRIFVPDCKHVFPRIQLSISFHSSHRLLGLTT